MVGNNEMLLNEATMKEAVQLWLDREFARGAPTVMGILQTDDCTFRVSLSSDADRPGPSEPQS